MNTQEHVNSPKIHKQQCFRKNRKGSATESHLGKVKRMKLGLLKNKSVKIKQKLKKFKTQIDELSHLWNERRISENSTSAPWQNNGQNYDDCSKRLMQQYDTDRCDINGNSQQISTASFGKHYERKRHSTSDVKPNKTKYNSQVGLNVGQFGISQHTNKQRSKQKLKAQIYQYQTHQTKFKNIGTPTKINRDNNYRRLYKSQQKRKSMEYHRYTEEEHQHQSKLERYPYNRNLLEQIKIASDEAVIRENTDIRNPHKQSNFNTQIAHFNLKKTQQKLKSGFEGIIRKNLLHFQNIDIGYKSKLIKNNRTYRHKKDQSMGEINIKINEQKLKQIQSIQNWEKDCCKKYRELPIQNQYKIKNNKRNVTEEIFELETQKSDRSDSVGKIIKNKFKISNMNSNAKAQNVQEQQNLNESTNKDVEDNRKQEIRQKRNIWSLGSQSQLDRVDNGLLLLKEQNQQNKFLKNGRQNDEKIKNKTNKCGKNYQQNCQSQKATFIQQYEQIKERGLIKREQDREGYQQDQMVCEQMHYYIVTQIQKLRSKIVTQEGTLRDLLGGSRAQNNNDQDQNGCNQIRKEQMLKQREDKYNKNDEKDGEDWPGTMHNFQIAQQQMWDM